MIGEQPGDRSSVTILEPYLARIVRRRGNGLSRNMNRTLDYRPNIGEIIRRSFHWLVHAEIKSSFSGVHIRTTHLWAQLDYAHDWAVDSPAATFDVRHRTPLTYSRYASAIAIGRRIDLFCGHGQVRLTDTVRRRIQACIESHHYCS